MAMLGAGEIIHDFLPVAKELKGLELSAMFSTKRNIEEKESLQSEYGIGRLYFDFDEMLETCDADCYYIALPTNLHYKFTKKALEAGKNIILEKPCTSSLREFLVLKELAVKNNLFMIEAITTLHMKNYLALKKCISRIGDIKLAEINFTKLSKSYGRFLAGEVTAAFSPELSSGALMDIGVYNIHLAVGLFGLPLSTKYYATFEKGTDTNGVMLLKYKGFYCVLVIAKDCGAAIPSSIQGSLGNIFIYDIPGIIGPFDLELRNNDRTHFDESDHPHRMYAEFTEFIRIIEQKDRPAMLKHLDHSEKVMRVLDMAKESAGIIYPGDKEFDAEMIASE